MHPCLFADNATNHGVFPTNDDFKVVIHFGTHEVADHYEKMTESQFTEYMRELLGDLSHMQQERQKNGHTVSLIMMTTTPVETHMPNQCINGCSVEDFHCGLVPFRSNNDIEKFNEISINIMHEQVHQLGASWSLYDAHGVINNLCGEGYTNCLEFQNHFNVHFTPKGSQELAKGLEVVLKNL